MYIMDARESKSRYIASGGAGQDGRRELAAQQFDWDGFGNMEFHPTILDLPSEGPVERGDDAHAGTLDESALWNGDELVYNGNGNELSSFAALGFPSLDDWWTVLPNDIDAGSWNDEHLCHENASNSNSVSSTWPDSQSPQCEDGGNERKRRRRMPPQAKRLLTDCFDRHRKDPYIPKEEMQGLATETGLSLRQVQTFFANARARKLPRPAADRKGVDIPSATGQQGPMERFLSSSPEDEGISQDAVRKAASRMERPIKPLRSGNADAASVSESSHTSTSNSSSASMDSLDSRGSRKGRKRQREPCQNVDQTIFRKPSNPYRTYQCTFCTRDFEQKFDWKRHEESVHFPQKEWVCMPNGPLEDDRCVFCEEDNVDDEHLELHKSMSCSQAPRTQRTFQRKDKLVQHIKQVHGCQPPKLIKDWCQPIERDVLLLCGFCGLALPDWRSRADHISSHFTHGIVMDLWLPELPGSIWPKDEATQSFIRAKFSATEHPEGHMVCESCPSRFAAIEGVIMHRRQAHNIYHPHDNQVVLSKSTAGPHSHRLIKLAQQTSRIQRAHTRVQARSVPRLDYSALGSMEARPLINQILTHPEARGFSNAPHAVWREVLNRGAVAGSRVLGKGPGNPRSGGVLARGSSGAQSSVRVSSNRNIGDS